MKKNFLLIALWLCCLSTLLAQNQTYTGVISDAADNSPLPGVSVLLKGTSSGTVSDANGKFSLVASPGSTLILSYTGFTSSEIVLDNNTTLNLKLSADVKLLNEVLVVGYGSQNKREVTGAIATVKGSSIAQLPVPSFDAALQGRAAGLQVSQQGGSPGSPVRIQIRGTSSISSGTEPLYIVDGMPIFQDIGGFASSRTNNNLNPLANINPNDIESIEILKDAAATAIYGSRGANGVIIVTTKTGKRGQGRTTLDVNRGTSEAINLIDYAGGSDWLRMVDEARRNSINYGITAGQEAFNPAVLSNNSLPTPTGVSGPQFGPLTTWTRQLAEQTNTNWRDAMLQRGQVQEVNLSTSNGFDKGGFFISGQYRDEEGIIKTHRLQRYGVRANLDFSPSEKLRAGAKFNFSYLEFNQPQLGIGNNGGGIGRQNFGATGGWAQANIGSLPIMPIYNADGTYFDPLRGRNVVAGIDQSNFTSVSYQNRTIGTAYLEYDLLKNLTLHGEASVDFLNSLTKYWAGDIIRYNRVGQEEGRYINNRNFNAYLTYDLVGKGQHALTVVAGTETQKTNTRRQDYAFEGLQGAQQEIGEISNGQTQFITAVSGIFPDRFFLSYFGRANYKFKDRYLLGLSFRRDGSTVFGPENRYGNFPAASVGWILSDESFMSSGFLGRFNLLKVRASYGQTGNANIPSFAFVNTYANWPVYGQSPALGFGVLANPNIGWEKNNQFDAGLEFGLWGNRLSGSIGYYDRLSKEMLLNVPVAPNVGIGTGASQVITNIGDLRNRGFELQLSSVNLNKGDFRWSTDLNFSTVSNEVTRLTPQFEVLPSGSLPVATGIQSGSATITQIGGQLATFYLAEYAGLDAQGYESIYEIDKEVLRSTGKTVKTGNVIRATQANINANRIVHEGKTGLPTYYGGMTNTFSYKGFEVSALLTFQGGNYIYDGHEEASVYVRTGTNTIRADVLDNYWTENNTDAKYPRLTWNLRDNNNDASGRPAAQTLGTRTTRFLYKGDFIRLKTLQVAYALPTGVCQKLGLQGVRIYGNAQNLWTSTQFPGLDPELVLLGGSQDRNLNQGVIGNLPVPQVITFNGGISVTF